MPDERCTDGNEPWQQLVRVHAADLRRASTLWLIFAVAGAIGVFCYVQIVFALRPESSGIGPPVTVAAVGGTLLVAAAGLLGYELTVRAATKADESAARMTPPQTAYLFPVTRQVERSEDSGMVTERWWAVFLEPPSGVAPAYGYLRVPSLDNLPDGLYRVGLILLGRIDGRQPVWILTSTAVVQADDSLTAIQWTEPAEHPDEEVQDLPAEWVPLRTERAQRHQLVSVVQMVAGVVALLAGLYLASLGKDPTWVAVIATAGIGAGVWGATGVWSVRHPTEHSTLAGTL